MKGFTSVTLIALTLVPALAFAQAYQTNATQPPVSQPLVREGTLAVRMVEALNLGITSDEAQAENVLITVGVAPRNGWISDYPVTPDIAAELRVAIGDAADGRQLPIGRDEALTAFDDVMVAYGLNLNPSVSGLVEGDAPSYVPDNTVIYDYYNDEGPPVVTYYAPPPDYYYLYSWVPYPFWWSNFWFPGFFVLADFTFVIDGRGHHGHHDGFHHDGFRGHDEFVSNHFRDPATGRMSRIDPANRLHGGTFANRRWAAGWSGPSARNSAQAIFNRSQNVAMAGRSGAVRPPGNGTVSRPSLQKSTFTSSSGTRGTISGAPSRTTFNSPSATRGSTAPSWGGNRTFSAPSVSSRTSSPSAGSSRTFSAPPSGRSFSQPSVGSRSFAPSWGGNRTFSSPSVSSRTSSPSAGSSRTFSAPPSGRSFSQPSVGSRSTAPSWGGNRTFSAPSAGGSFRAPSGRGASNAGHGGAFRGM